MKKKTAILGIDLQNDFVLPQGALSVMGADKDMSRTIEFIQKHEINIDFIALTLDSHQPIHIAHQCYWKDKNGNQPELFSIITLEDVKSGKWQAQYNQQMAIPYLEQLTAKGEVCTIWNMHCILGSEGWAIHSGLIKCLTQWAISQDRAYELFYKGYAQNTEHYSIFRAAVEWSDQPETHLNTALLDKLKEYDEVLLIGQAADFCVASSLNDIMNESTVLSKKMVVLTDCMSWIIEGNERAKNIFDKASRAGVRFTTTENYSFG